LDEVVQGKWSRRDEKQAVDLAQRAGKAEDPDPIDEIFDDLPLERIQPDGWGFRFSGWGVHSP
jgi:hypothetical protein